MHRPHPHPNPPEGGRGSRSRATIARGPPVVESGAGRRDGRRHAASRGTHPPGPRGPMAAGGEQFLWSGNLIGSLAALAVLVVAIAFGALLGKALEGSPRRE